MSPNTRKMSSSTMFVFDGGCDGPAAPLNSDFVRLQLTPRGPTINRILTCRTAMLVSLSANKKCSNAALRFPILFILVTPTLLQVQILPATLQGNSGSTQVSVNDFNEKQVKKTEVFSVFEREAKCVPGQDSLTPPHSLDVPAFRESCRPGRSGSIEVWVRSSCPQPRVTRLPISCCRICPTRIF